MGKKQPLSFEQAEYRAALARAGSTLIDAYEAIIEKAKGGGDIQAALARGVHGGGGKARFRAIQQQQRRAGRLARRARRDARDEEREKARAAAEGKRNEAQYLRGQKPKKVKKPKKGRKTRKQRVLAIPRPRPRVAPKPAPTPRPAAAVSAPSGNTGSEPRVPSGPGGGEWTK